jgi:hypothetical protein
MSSVIDETPQKGDDEILSSTVKRDVERRIRTADEMIDSIRAELFTPPSQQGEPDEMVFHDDDYGEMYDEIKRLPSVEEDIRRDLNSQDVDSVRRSFLGEVDASTQQSETDCVTHQKHSSGSQVEIDRFWLFSMIAFWVIVFLKEWFATLR